MSILVSLQFVPFRIIAPVHKDGFSLLVGFGCGRRLLRVKDLFLFEQPLSHVLGAWNILRHILWRGWNTWKAKDGLPAAGLNGVDTHKHQDEEKEFVRCSQNRCRHLHGNSSSQEWSAMIPFATSLTRFKLNVFVVSERWAMIGARVWIASYGIRRMRISCWHGTPSLKARFWLAGRNYVILGINPNKLFYVLAELTTVIIEFSDDFWFATFKWTELSWRYVPIRGFPTEHIRWECTKYRLGGKIISTSISQHNRKRSAHKPPCLSSSYIATASYFYTCSTSIARDEIPDEIVVRWEPCRNHADTFLVSPSCDRTTSTLTTICLRRAHFH